MKLTIYPKVGKEISTDFDVAQVNAFTAALNDPGCRFISLSSKPFVLGIAVDNIAWYTVENF